MSLVVRRGRLADAETVVLFNQRLARESEDHDLAPELLTLGVQRVLGDDSLGHYFVAEEEGRIVGQTMVTFEWSDWRNGMFWWIQSVYVLPEARKLGVFSLLHDAIRDAAREDGAIGLRLYVYDANTLAREVYLRRGMKDSSYRVFEQLF